jgi:hypothetical protein
MPTKTSTPFSYTINEDCNALYPPVSVISPNPPTTNLLGAPSGRWVMLLRTTR